MRIKEVIKKAGFTYEDIAKAMNTTAAAVSQIVNGNPTVGKLDEIAKIIGVSRGEFFLDEMANYAVFSNENARRNVSGISLNCPYCGKPVSLGLIPIEKEV